MLQVNVFFWRQNYRQEQLPFRYIGNERLMNVSPKSIAVCFLPGKTFIAKVPCLCSLRADWLEASRSSGALGVWPICWDYVILLNHISDIQCIQNCCGNNYMCVVQANIRYTSMMVTECTSMLQAEQGVKITTSLNNSTRSRHNHITKRWRHTYLSLFNYFIVLGLGGHLHGKQCMLYPMMDSQESIACNDGAQLA